MSKHLKLTLSKKPPDNSLVSMKAMNVKHSLFTKLFGAKNKVAIIIPGDDVGSIEIVDDKESYINKTNRGGLRAGSGR